MLRRTNPVTRKALTRHTGAESHGEQPCIIASFALQDTAAMEAEQLNSISNKLDDIAQRAAELRRYL